jgi:hypothetical protein
MPESKNGKHCEFYTSAITTWRAYCLWVTVSTHKSPTNGKKILQKIQMSTVQRRHYSRIRFCGSAIFQAELDQWPCDVLDLSLRGALITAEFPKFAIDTPCLLELRLNDDVCVRMEGHVAHRHGDQIGIVCDVTDLDSISHLRRLLALNLGDASLLDREFSTLLAAQN